MNKKAKINALIRGQCCNYVPEYNGDTDVCLYTEKKCQQLVMDDLKCKWFKSAVLSCDKDLRGAMKNPDGVKKCAVCGMEFFAGSNRALYCDKCRRYMTTKQAAGRMRKKREQ